MALLSVYRISVKNSAGFDLKFRVTWGNGQISEWSKSYPNPEVETLDLTTVPGLEAGDTVALTVHADLGKTKTTSGDNDVIFDPTSQVTGSYDVTGATLDFSITLTN